MKKKAPKTIFKGDRVSFTLDKKTVTGDVITSFKGQLTVLLDTQVKDGRPAHSIESSLATKLEIKE